MNLTLVSRKGNLTSRDRHVLVTSFSTVLQIEQFNSLFSTSGISCDAEMPECDGTVKVSSYTLPMELLVLSVLCSATILRRESRSRAPRTRVPSQSGICIVLASCPVGAQTYWKCQVNPGKGTWRIRSCLLTLQAEPPLV